MVATGWSKSTHRIGKFNAWSHPEVHNGQMHTQPAAVRRQQERDSYLAPLKNTRPCPNCGGEFMGLDPAHDPSGSAAAEARRVWEEKRASCTTCGGKGVVR